MTRDKAKEILQNWDDCVWREQNHITMGDVSDALHLAEKALSNPWHKVSEELPPVDTEVVCKMNGVPYTEHFICKWDGKYWWHWNCYDRYIQGWFGLNDDWEVVEWKEI